MRSLPRQLQSVLPELTVLGLFLACWMINATWLFVATLISLGIFFILRYRQGEDQAAREELLGQLAAANDRLTEIGAQIPGFVFQLQRDSEGQLHFPYASEGILDIFSISPGQVGRCADLVWGLTHPEDQDELCKSLNDSAEKLTEWQCEYRIRSADDETRWLYVNASPRQLATGVVQWHGFLCDITQRRERERQAETVDAYLQAVFSADTEVSIIATDLNGKVQLFNSGAEKMLGYTAHEVVGQFALDQLHLDGEVDALARQYEKGGQHTVQGFEVLAECGRGGTERHREWTYVCKCGKHKTVRLEITGIRDKSGQIGGYLAIASDVTALNASRRELEATARYDRLTGLLNRHSLLQTVDQKLNSPDSQDQDLSLMFLDFDRFKIVNDSLGHEVGDQLLVAIGQRLNEFVSMISDQDVSSRPGDLAARFGGDEFILLVCGASDHVEAYADELRTVLEQPYVIGGVELRSTASIGIVTNQGQYSSANDMVRDADVAMYESKRSGRGNYLVFDTPMRAHVQRQLKLEADLAMAIERNELQLVYQPIVTLETGKLYGVEGLLRWKHHTDGWISPEEFIPIAEDAGMIQEICDWVVFEGCCQLTRWDIELGALSPQNMSLNLSPRQFASLELAGRVNRIVHDAGVDPGRIIFELTESALMSEPDVAAEVLQRIKDQGSRIALDDFGIGNSSFASLHRFPVDILKFDRSFIHGVQNKRDLASLVHAMAVLARNLGISTVAEGIEQPEQFLAVRELGCALAQGYLIAKPLSATALSMFARHQASAVPTGQGAKMFEDFWDPKIDLSV